MRRFAILIVLACLPTLLAFFARWSWICDLFTHYRVYYAAILWPCGALLLFVRRWRLVAAGVLIVGLFNAALVAPLYRSPTGPSTTGSAAERTPLRVLVANVNTQNRRYELVNALIAYEDADLVLLMEVHGPWLAALEDSLHAYPHRIERPRDDNFGIALYSRLPLENAEVIELGEAEVPSVVASFTVGGKRVSALGTHPLPPMPAQGFAHRNDQLRAIAEQVQKGEGPWIVMGDLNTTSWSPHFRDLVADTDLVDTRRGFGVQPTWTAFRGLVRLPIDHVLVSPEISTTGRRVGMPIGSDHLPVIVELEL